MQPAVSGLRLEVVPHSSCFLLFLDKNILIQNHFSMQNTLAGAWHIVLIGIKKKCKCPSEITFFLCAHAGHLNIKCIRFTMENLLSC